MPKPPRDLLVSVAAVCSPDMAGLPHVATAIHRYLDGISTKWTLESASAKGSVRLLDRLVAYEWPGVGQAFREQRFNHAIHECITDHAVGAGNDDITVAVLQWWMIRYLPEKASESVSTIFRLAVRFRRLGVLQWLKAQGLLNPSVYSGLGLVECPYSDVAYWLHDNAPGITLLLRLVNYSTEGNLAYVQWANSHRNVHAVKSWVSAASAAAIYGRWDELQWLHENGLASFAFDTLDRVIQSGQLSVAKWLCENFPDQSFSDPHGGVYDLDCAKWLASKFKWKEQQKRIAWIDKSIETAASLGEDRLALIEFLYSVRPQVEFSGDAIAAAAAQGHLSVVKCIHARGVGTTVDAMDRAAANGHLYVVQWLQENRTEGCSNRAMNDAATNGHLTMVQWLHFNRSEGCTTAAMSNAASHGHLEIVKWLHENHTEGCTTSAMNGAAANGHLEIVQWLTENRSEGCTARAMDHAAAAGRLDIIQFLHSHRQEGCTAAAMRYAAMNGHLDVVRWLFHNKAERWTVTALYDAVTAGNLEMVRFLVVHCGLTCDVRALATATKAKQFAVREWLLKHTPVQ